MLSFPLAGVPADKHQAHRDLEAGLCIPEGGDEGVQSLYGGEPAYVDQDDAGGESRDLVGVVAKAAWGSARYGTLRAGNEDLMPEPLPVSWTGSEQRGVDPTRKRHHPLGRDVKHRRRTPRPGR